MRALGTIVADEVLEELHNLRRVAQAVPRLGLARGLGDDGPYAAEAAHDGEGVLVSHLHLVRVSARDHLCACSCTASTSSHTPKSCA